MVVGDMEYQFGWEDGFIGKGDKIDTEKRDLFFSAVKHALWDVTEANFNIMFPKFKDVEINDIALESILKYRVSPFYVKSEHIKGLESHYTVRIQIVLIILVG